MALAQILPRRGTSAQWLAANPVLAKGEMGYDETARRVKFGDGGTPWTGLQWGTVDSATINAILSVAEQIADATGANDAVMTATVADEDSAFRQALNATIGSVGQTIFVPAITPETYGTEAEIAADAGPAINMALAAARAFGAAVYLAPKVYRVRTMINVGSVGSHLFGAGMGKTILDVFGQASMMDSVIGHYSNATGVRLHDFTVRGTIVDDVTGPRRDRTQTSNGFNCAVKIAGDLAPGVTTVARDVSIDRVEVIGSASLPIWLSGVRGDARIADCRFRLTMDVGWTWCERVQCLNNTSYKSADNGFSISRGCLSAVVIGNMVEMAAFWGVWVAGFKQGAGAPTDAGPSNFAVTGNTVVNVGYGGICADEAPKNGVITGNTVKGVSRGPSDYPSNIWGVGVLVGGFPLDARPAPTDYAENIVVSDNVLVDCARGGVQYVGARNIDIKDNMIIRPGSQYMADGTTVIASTVVDQNFGVSTLAGAQNTSSRITIQGNTMIDDRATPLMNYPWYTASVVTPIVVGNRQVGGRQSAVLIHDNTDLIVHSGIHTWQSNSKFTAGATAGASAATGTIEGFDVNGAAGSDRLCTFRTGGARRWTVRASSAAEAGSNVGSRFLISAYDDSGAPLYDALSIRRETGTVTFRVTNTAGRPSATAAGVGAQMYDSTLSKPIWSDGAAWRDAAGAAV